MKELIGKCLKFNYKNDSEESFDETVVFSIETDTDKLLFWNCNNDSEFDEKYILSEIVSQLLSGELDGICYEPFACVEIMWEVKEL